jgi:hypothetical protein
MAWDRAERTKNPRVEEPHKKPVKVKGEEI